MPTLAREVLPQSWRRRREAVLPPLGLLRLCLRLYGKPLLPRPRPQPARRSPAPTPGAGRGADSVRRWRRRRWQRPRSLFPGRTRLCPPRLSPAELPALPSQPRSGARPPPAPCPRQPCCSCPRCWRSWLTVRDPGVRRQGQGPGGGKRGLSPSSAPRIWLPSPGTALRRLLCPPRRPSRAGRGLRGAGSCRCSRHSHPAETSPLIISPDLMGFLSCNSSRHPLPAHTHAFTRALPLHTPWASRSVGVRVPGGGRHRAVNRDGPAGGPQSRLPCRPPNFVRLCRRFRGLSQRRDGARWRRDPELGLRPPLSALALPRRGRDLEYHSREKLEGPGDPYLAPCSALGCNS